MQAPDFSFVEIPFAPYRLSGTVLGTLMNDPVTLAALGDAVHQPPYKAPPVAPVLYVKPRNTFAAAGVPMPVLAGGEIEVGVSLGLIIGRTACRAAAHDALAFVAGYALVADLCIPHASFYRPSVRFRALDGSCRIGAVVPRDSVADPQSLSIVVEVDGQLRQRADSAGFVRQSAQLIADVSHFMSLRPGDVLMLGVPAGAPRVRAGERARITIAGIGSVEIPFEAAA